ncbi:MAG: lactoylglutathione lyase family protein [Mycoplasmataceae bacterium]|nr:lactoylglutathione lyase family protein [Mycoplasmataceae bacterium]
MKKAYPKSFSHIGLSVPNLEEATKFYNEVFGWYLIMKPTTVKLDNSPIGVMCDDVFGKDWKEFKIAHMATSDKIGIELFEFLGNSKPANNLDYKRNGVFHYSIQDPNLEELVKEVIKRGGKQLTNINYYYPGEKPYRMVYMEDPFGIVFEIYSHSYELTYSSGAY